VKDARPDDSAGAAGPGIVIPVEVHPLRIGYEHADGIARITLDDGKANAMSTAWFRELGAALDRAQADGAGALLVRGRPRFFSGGLDLKLLPTLSPAEMREMTETFASTFLRLYALPIPTVACVTGHAIAGGAVLAFACDARYATEGPYRIQMNEVAIGIPLPSWMLVIGESAIPATARNEALLHARGYAPAEALAHGVVGGVGATPEEKRAPRASGARGLAAAEPRGLRRIQGACARQARARAREPARRAGG
jgi:enoyl-CoA hydratase